MFRKKNFHCKYYEGDINMVTLIYHDMQKIYYIKLLTFIPVYSAYYSKLIDLFKKIKATYYVLAKCWN